MMKSKKGMKIMMCLCLALLLGTGVPMGYVQADVASLPGPGATAQTVQSAQTETAEGGNLLVNSGFEASGLQGWTTFGAADAASRIGGSAGYNFKSGSYSLRHLKGAAYEAWTYQTVTGLSDGIYSASAWVRRPNTAVSHDAAQMEVAVGPHTVGGSVYAPQYALDIGTTTQAAFSRITINNIVVQEEAGEVTIVFYSKASAAGPVLYVDDVEFTFVSPVGEVWSVAFQTNGGSPLQTVQVPGGSPLAPPQQPVREGYSFSGWYADAGFTAPYDFLAPVEANMMLYAKWQAVAADPGNLLGNPGFEEGTWNQWKITSTLPSASIATSAGPGTDVPRSGAAALKLTQSKRFEAWVSQRAEDLEKGYYTAKAWVKRPVAARADDTFVMRVSGNGTSPREAAIPVSAGYASVEIPFIPVTTGACLVEFYLKTFDGHMLFIDDAELRKSGQPLTGLFANFDSVGGSFVPSVEADGANLIAPPAAPRKTGYEFAGWYRDSGLTDAFDFSRPIAGDVTLYAKWQSRPMPMIGNIRWDVMTGYAPFDELNSLSTPKHSHRAPFFTTVDVNHQVTGHNNSVAAMEQEIGYAAGGGIDYWAFTTGPDMGKNNPEYYALDKFLASTNRHDMGFSIILHRYNANPWENRVDMLVKWMQEPNYVQIMGNRPLVYIYRVAELEAQYGAGAKDAIGLIRSKAAEAGLGNPYIVAMASATENSLAENKAYVESLELDAISAYSYAGERTENNAASYLSYKELAEGNTASWERYRAVGAPFVPLVSLGRNEEPRKDTPVVYGGGHGPYFDAPTPEEAARQIRAGLDYVEAHREVCESNTILSYAWNEFAEGGWIAPTLAEGSARLDAIRQMKDGNPGGSNLLVNPGFESGSDGWLLEGDSAAVSVSAESYYGSAALAYSAGQAYEAAAIQQVTGLLPGKYRLVAQVRSSGGQHSAGLSVTDGQSATVYTPIPPSAEWKQLRLDIEVTTGECIIRIESEAAGGDWLMVDALELYRISLPS
ncbi:MAG: hypothetical protein K0R57_2153 [Paenibacillaceae bacterium]|jgi:uncharacterized repeat protein (TIGR02543 family)|nr:hypothetical protein [Paenibacillaceae bacterium]